MVQSCPYTGKSQFRSERHAKDARVAIGKHGASKSKFRIYKCPHCFFYHFTSHQRV